MFSGKAAKEEQTKTKADSKNKNSSGRRDKKSDHTSEECEKDDLKNKLFYFFVA